MKKTDILDLLNLSQADQERKLAEWLPKEKEYKLFEGFHRDTCFGSYVPIDPNLAFKLRRKAIEKWGREAWFNVVTDIHKQLFPSDIQSPLRDIGSYCWFLIEAEPIHFIIAYLLLEAE